MSTPLSGAREGGASALRRMLARAAARELRALVVPGPEVARALGLDIEAAGLPLAAGPRQANVLVVLAGLRGLPEGLERAASVSYAQMPRPRAALIVGPGPAGPLPADATCEPEQGSLEAAVRGLRRAFREGSFAGDAEDFAAPALETRTVYTCSMHPEVEQEQPGQCPKCGMDLIPGESAGEGMDHDHESGGHGHHEEQAHEEHGEHGEHGSGESGEVEGSGHDHAGHEHMDFMSMVEMTQGTPRSSDGLQMEWIEAPFGPLLPGLPGGLSLSFTLDGDTVAGAEATVETRDAEGFLHGPASGLPGRLSELDPLSPVAYRLLAALALEDAATVTAPEDERLRRISAIELERAASHAGWLSGFACLLGMEPLRREAARLELRLRRPPTGPPEAGDDGALEAAASLSRRLNGTRLLRRRLYGIGVLQAEEAAVIGGPIARSAGHRRDLRDADYGALGFEPVLEEGSDALARLRLRLGELEQSLRLAHAALQGTPEPGPGIEAARSVDSGEGRAAVETPRGPATLRITVEGGEVTGASLVVPSGAALALTGAVVVGRELGDALVGVASLDLSPWGCG